MDEGGAAQGVESSTVHPVGTKARRTADTNLRTLYALVGIAGSAFIPFYALLLDDRGLSADHIGLVLAVTSLAGVAATPFWGHAADARLGTVRTLQLACGGACVAALFLTATGSSLFAIAAVAAVLGAMQAPQAALTDALTLRELGAVRLTDYGTFRLWASIGWGVGAVAFGALFAGAGTGLGLPMYVVGLAVCGIFVSRFPPARADSSSGLSSRFGSMGDALRSIPRLASFMAGVLILATSTHAAWDFVPLRIVSRGGGAFLVGVAGGMSAFVEIPFMRWSPSLIRRLGLRMVFVAGTTVYVAASIAWALVDDPVAVAAVRVAIGVGFGLAYVTLVVMTGRLVPGRLRNTGQALLSVSSFGLAPVVGAGLGGWVYEHVGPAQLFAGSAFGIAAGMIVVYLAARGIEEPSEEIVRA